MLGWLAAFFASVFANWVMRPCVLSLRSRCFGGLLSSVVGEWLIASGLLVFVAWCVLVSVGFVVASSVRVAVCVVFGGGVCFVLFAWCRVGCACVG